MPATLGASPPGTIDLVARVEALGELGLPLAVSVVMPPGVTQVGGPRSYVIPVMTRGATHDVAMRFLAPLAPSEDLILVVDAQSSERGVHARAPYRFGRLDAVITPLTLDPRSINAGRYTFGPGVLMRTDAP